MSWISRRVRAELHLKTLVAYDVILIGWIVTQEWVAGPIPTLNDQLFGHLSLFCLFHLLPKYLGAYLYLM